MDTRTFLHRVSAPVDSLVISLWKPDPSGKNPRGIFWNEASVADIDEAAQLIEKLDKGKDRQVYFSVGRMSNNEYTRDNGKPGYYRTKEHATVFKAICFDLDVGPKTPYPGQKEGHEAINAFRKLINLPAPMVVSSGGGLHYYWPLTAAIPKAHWEQVSRALRLALDEHKVTIDSSKIHDASMVLRPAGAHNKKKDPWRQVTVLADCADYKIEDLEAILSKWMDAAKQPTPSKAKLSAVKKNSIFGAILVNANLNLDVLGNKCNQICVALQTGGAQDPSGNLPAEPWWRGMLAMAAYTPEPEVSVVRLAGEYPNFDLQENLNKMAGWSGGPPTCAYFEQHCPSGCAGCPYRGQIKSPASINEEVVEPLPAEVSPTNDEVPVEVKLPEGYFIDNGKVWTEVSNKVVEKDEEGKKIERWVKEKVLVCPYEIHVTAMYADLAMEQTSASVAVKYPHGGWKLHEMPVDAVATFGQSFQQFISNKQMFISNDELAKRTRKYLMDYLSRVQAAMPSGTAFTKFGWQEDGSFLCGEHLIGAPSGNLLRHLRGAAQTFGEILTTKGSREAWADATRMIDTPDGDILGVNLLVAASGALGNISGAGCSILSTYSDTSGTGKTLGLLLGNSLSGEPNRLLIPPTSTDNAIYKALGTLGDISGAIDEVTKIDSDRAVELVYNVSQGQEKMSLTRERDIRGSERWNAPTRVTSNASLYSKYDMVMFNTDAVRMRTFEFEHRSHQFAENFGTDMYTAVTTNYGFGMPELVDAILRAGGRRVVWEKAVDKFERQFKFTFEAQERFFRAACINSYAVGVIGQAIGLFRFDVNRVIEFMLKRVLQLRANAAGERKDAFDIIGQFMQEYNHQLIVFREETNRKGIPQLPVPDNACIRLDLRWDAKNPVLPGSRIYINTGILAKWLMRTKDTPRRLAAELKDAGALIRERDRVSMYKGCGRENPGQAHCMILDAMHPRFAQSFTSASATPQTAPALAILQGGA